MNQHKCYTLALVMIENQIFSGEEYGFHDMDSLAQFFRKKRGDEFEAPAVYGDHGENGQHTLYCLDPPSRRIELARTAPGGKIQLTKAGIKMILERTMIAPANGTRH